MLCSIGQERVCVSYHSRHIVLDVLCQPLACTMLCSRGQESVCVRHTTADALCLVVVCQPLAELRAV